MIALTYREATEADFPFIDGLVDTDPVAAKRDAGLADNSAAQRAAITNIAADPHHFLYVVEQAGEPVGSFQLSFIPGLSRRGT